MPSFVVGGFLLVHGLITTMIGVGGIAAPNAPAMTLPSWLGWWPGPFGRSWLIDALGLGTTGAVAGGIIWLIAGLALLGAGLRFLGLPLVHENWQTLAFAGGLIGLVAAALYFHPLYIAAIAINVVLVAFLWGRLSAAAT